MTNPGIKNFRPSKRTVLAGVLIFMLFSILAFSIYSGTLGSPFVFDDKGRIEINPHIRITQFSPLEIVKAGFNSSKTRPIAFMSFALNYYFNQYDPRGYHIVNIIIHVLAGYFLYLFINTTLKIPSLRSQYDHPNLIAVFAALIWLVHPVQTQSVTYIVQRLNSMASLFFILSFWLYVKGRLAEAGQRRWLWYLASTIAWLLSLGCKQITVTLPFFVFLYEWYFLRDLSKDWLKRNLKYVLGILIIMVLIALVYTGFNPWEKLSQLNDFAQNEFTLNQRILTQFRVVIYYISLFFYPHPARLNIDYDFPLSYSLINPITTLLSLGIIVGLLALAIYLARRQRLISFGILWFFGNLVIESSIIPLAIIFEYRMYLPSMMVGLILVSLVFSYIKLNWLRYGLVCIVLASLSLWTYERNKVWQSKITLWQDSIKKSPNKARPHYNLGEAYANLNMINEAIPQFLRSLELNPEDAAAHHNLAVMLASQGNSDVAISHYRQALHLNPNSAATHNDLGLELSKQNRLDEAIMHYRKALQLRPDNVKTLYNLGDALARQGRTEQAINHLYQAVRIKPDFTAAQNNLGGQLLKQGRTDEALNHFIAALEVDPNLAEAHNNVGIIRVQQGDLEAAITHFQKAVRIRPDFKQAVNNLNRALAMRNSRGMQGEDIQNALKNKPDDPELHYQLGNFYLGQGELSKAIAEFEIALALKPKFIAAQNNLAMAYAAGGQYDQALAAFKKLLKLDPDNVSIDYNIAVLYALQNNVPESIRWLKKAVDRGYQNWELIKTDKDLANIRDSEGYRQLVEGR